MKKLVIIAAVMCFLAGPAFANDAGFGFSAGYGLGSDGIDIYRVGLMKKWGVRWLESSTGYVDGYFELSCNLWDGGGDRVNAVALSPVFVYVFTTGSNGWHPYIEAGIGPACLDTYHIKDRNLASNLMFEDRIGLGIRFDNFDLCVRYMHYSNASIREPNDGIDILAGTLSYFF